MDRQRKKERRFENVRVAKAGEICVYLKTVETMSDFILGALKSLQMVTAAMKLKDAYSLEGKYDQPR